jgi:hypothetical protein
MEMYYALVVDSVIEFSFWMTKTQVDFQIIGMYLPIPPCIPHSRFQISNQLKYLLPPRIPKSNIWCMPQIPQYCFCCFQMNFPWRGLKSCTRAYTKHYI